MTLKLHGGWRASVKQSRRLRRIPAAKRLGDCIRAGWLKRYKLKNLGNRPRGDRGSAVWTASKIEIDHQREQQAEYDTWCRQQERREFWRTLTLPIRWPIFRLLERIWPRKSLSVLTDDEIPF